MRRITVELLLLVACAIAGTSIAGPFEDGIAAYDQGQLKTAFKLWLLLAEQGHAAAQFNIAVMYEKGAGVAQDPAEAARWYLEAANQGEAEGQYKVGLLYETGAGLTRDLAEASRWYRAVIANPREDKAALAAKKHARQRFANLAVATQQIISYQAGRYVIVRSQDGACVIALQGMINSDATWKFDDVIASSEKLGCGKPWLMLESPGGLLFEGFKLGREVRSHGFRTITRYDCASACASIFLGGVERVLAGSRARIGLHQAALVNANTDKRRCDTAMDSPERRDLRRYLHYTIPATSDQVMELIMRTSCDDIEWTYGQRALELGIATSLEAESADIFGPKGERR